MGRRDGPSGPYSRIDAVAVLRVCDAGRGDLCQSFLGDGHSWDGVAEGGSRNFVSVALGLRII